MNCKACIRQRAEHADVVDCEFWSERLSCFACDDVCSETDGEVEVIKQTEEMQMLSWWFLYNCGAHQQEWEPCVTLWRQEIWGQKKNILK